MSWGGKLHKVAEQSSAQTSANAFQQYLDKSSDELSPLDVKDLTPDVIRSLAQNLMLALDRASMNALFFDTDSRQRTSTNFLSTDLFMAMRNSSAAAVSQAQAQASSSNIADATSEQAVIVAEQSPNNYVLSNAKGREVYAPIITQAAERYDLDPKLIEAVIQTESDFNPQVVSHAGAQGLMQLMPGTAADLGVKDVFDPEENIDAGSRYLKQLMDRYDGDEKLALAAYNWGMGNLERHPERMPEETVNYVAKITGLMNNAA